MFQDESENGAQYEDESKEDLPEMTQDNLAIESGKAKKNILAPGDLIVMELAPSGKLICTVFIPTPSIDNLSKFYIHAVDLTPDWVVISY